MTGHVPIETATFEKAEGIPLDVQRVLAQARVPKASIGRLYSAVHRLEAIVLPGRGLLVKFGCTHLTGSITYDPITGEVLQLSETPGGDPHFVNSTLDQFSRCIRAVVEMFPLYDRESTDDEREQAASRVSGTVKAIDRSAIAADSFWETFVNDVAIGDYATEELTPTHRGQPDSPRVS